MEWPGFAGEQKHRSFRDASKERLASCYSISPSLQVFTPAFESHFLFNKQNDRDSVKAAFSSSHRAGACGNRIPSRLLPEKQAGNWRGNCWLT